ncbi:serine/threonine-protein phosphatase PGAM5, mitochondrial isoform X3 [Dermatophagoides farinae]|uniref:serine/threonine-protein phosphatase PGAM5, mitochondrial isoform X3 n=1 Tax=Dermatophagoides farinae TaxID=6954 RepID=UPI001F10506A|nr:serine/threonine-protein phosphatase PGAM5, mitochondrial-like isoform X2 [Dermatophagoides farinae]
MSILRGTKKLLLAAGLAGCGAAAAVLFTGLHKDTESFKAHASSASLLLPDYKFINLHNYIATKWDYNWDRREPNSLIAPIKGDFGSLPECDQDDYNRRLEKAKSTATRHLLLIRHGQYRMDADTDELRQLTSLGRDQANRIGERLKELDLPYTRIIKSTMTRATETAEIIHTHLPDIPMTACDFIREGSPIVPEPPISNWKPEPKFFQDGARIESAFRKYFHRADPSQKQDSYDILVCHGNVIRYFVCRALQFPPEGWLRFSLYNCSMTWVAIKPSGRVIVYTVGDTGHLSRAQMTTN